MEKRSAYYLTREATHQICSMGWWSTYDNSAFDIANTAVIYGEARKRKLVQVEELRDKRGLGASLARFRLQCTVKIDGAVNKAAAWYGNPDNYRKLIEVDRIVAGDIGKIGVH